MTHFNAVVWIDHRGAHIHSFNWDESENVLVRHKDAPHKLHSKASGTPGSQHEHEDKAYLSAVLDALQPFGEILIVGPGLAKTELKKYLDREAPSVADRVVGVVPMDHPSDGQLLDFARRYFRRWLDYSSKGGSGSN
jgi:stalled ribosome rescue protein Dom34